MPPLPPPLHLGHPGPLLRLHLLLSLELLSAAPPIKRPTFLAQPPLLKLHLQPICLLLQLHLRMMTLLPMSHFPRTIRPTTLSLLRLTTLSLLRLLRLVPWLQAVAFLVCLLLGRHTNKQRSRLYQATLLKRKLKNQLLPLLKIQNMLLLLRLLLPQLFLRNQVQPLMLCSLTLLLLLLLLLFPLPLPPPPIGFIQTCLRKQPANQLPRLLLPTTTDLVQQLDLCPFARLQCR